MLQTRLQGELNGVRDKAGRLCMQTLAAHNSPVVMASCGSKGSSINIAQMVALVGQQAVAGKRCQDGFVGRTTPHFPRCVGNGVLVACLQTSLAVDLRSATPPCAHVAPHALAGVSGRADSYLEHAFEVPHTESSQLATRIAVPSALAILFAATREPNLHFQVLP